MSKKWKKKFFGLRKKRGLEIITVLKRKLIKIKNVEKMSKYLPDK